MIRFLHPQTLWLLLLLPPLIAMYLAVLRKSEQARLRYANLSFVAAGAGAAFRLRRHVPPAILLIAIAVLILAGARPMAKITLPFARNTVILAIDTSLSMSADDVQPSRLASAQAAARVLVNDQPSHTQVGVVAFSTSAQLVQPPTVNREAILDAIDRLRLQNATALGTAVLVSLQAIFPDLEVDLMSQELDSRIKHKNLPGTPLDRSLNGNLSPAESRTPGSYASAAIILLSDGQATTGPNPVEAARLAAQLGVRIFTVGVGTPQGKVLLLNGTTVQTRLDEKTLKEMADVTKAEYFYASTATDLTRIYQGLSNRLINEKAATEITALFALAGAILTLLSGSLSLFWFNRIL